MKRFNKREKELLEIKMEFQLLEENLASGKDLINRLIHLRSKIGSFPLKAKNAFFLKNETGKLKSYELPTIDKRGISI